MSAAALAPAVRLCAPVTARVPAAQRLPELAVCFARDGRGRTYVAAQRATHPYHLCRALYRPDDPPGLCTLYAQSSAGGLFEGDRVRAAFRAEVGARAHITTAAATIVHRMAAGGRAEQEISVEIASGALLELLPDPLILFPGSRLAARLRISLAPGARAIVAESFLVHELPDDDGPFALLDGETRIEDDAGRLLARERSAATGEALRSEGHIEGRSDGSWRGGTTVMVLGAGAEPLEPLRAALGQLPRTYGGASELAGGAGVLARLLAADGVALRSGVAACWRAGRLALGLPAGRVRPK